MQVNVTEIQEFVVDYAQNHLSQDIKTFIPFFEGYAYQNILYPVDIICSANAAYAARRYSEEHSVQLSRFSTLLICYLTYFGGTLVKVLCGDPCGGYLASYNFISIFLGWALIFCSPLDLGYYLYKYSIVLSIIRSVCNLFFTDYAITSWGADVAIKNNLSFTAALSSSLICCYAGSLLSEFWIYNTEKKSFFDTLNDHYKKEQSHMDRCLVLSIVYNLLYYPYDLGLGIPHLSHDEARLVIFVALVACNVFTFIFRIDPCTILLKLILFTVDRFAPNRKCFDSKEEKPVVKKEAVAVKPVEEKKVVVQKEKPVKEEKPVVKKEKKNNKKNNKQKRD